MAFSVRHGHESKSLSDHLRGKSGSNGNGAHARSDPENQRRPYTQSMGLAEAAYRERRYEDAGKHFLKAASIALEAKLPPEVSAAPKARYIYTKEEMEKRLGYGPLDKPACTLEEAREWLAIRLIRIDTFSENNVDRMVRYHNAIAFAVSIGMPFDDVVRLISTAPKFYSQLNQDSINSAARHAFAEALSTKNTELAEGLNKYYNLGQSVDKLYNNISLNSNDPAIAAAMSAAGSFAKARDYRGAMSAAVWFNLPDVRITELSSAPKIESILADARASGDANAELIVFTYNSLMKAGKHLAAADFMHKYAFDYINVHNHVQICIKDYNAIYKMIESALSYALEDAKGKDAPKLASIISEKIKLVQHERLSFSRVSESNFLNKVLLKDAKRPQAGEAQTFQPELEFP